MGGSPDLGGPLVVASICIATMYGPMPGRRRSEMRDNGGVTDPVNLPEPDEQIARQRAEASVPLEHEVERDVVTVRRAPRYSRFMTLGALVGAVVALILTVSFPANDDFDRGQVFGFLLLACAAIGLALGALIALLIDRATARRAKSVTVEHETIHPVDE